MADPAPPYDLLVIGGGINGTGIARDAAGRGLSVLLCEADDLAAHTSSASTKLIHGGLRYLEYYEFRLVRKALQEREVLLRSAPHIMWPLRFVMPHDPAMRPVWMIRIGLFLYDHLARRNFLPGSGTVDLSAHVAGAALDERFRRGFIYSDGWVDDARLVALNAVDARERGAAICTHTRCVRARRDTQGWRVGLRDERSGAEREVRARGLINAAGPWVAHTLADELQVTSRHRIRLVKGSHIVVPRLFDHSFAYIFQNPDKRVIFAIPYEHDFTLIGTTDVDFHGDPGEVAISAEEIAYLCMMASRYFRRPILASDVVRTYSGVRPLLEDDANDATSVTRDYWLELNTDGAPILSVFGGKITTFRRLAEEAMDAILPALGADAQVRRHWTAGVTLPGGDLPQGDFPAFVISLCERFAWLPLALATRYARAYGTLTYTLIGEARAMTELGAEIAPGVREAELAYLRDREWALTGEDVLWRRSKLGLHLTEEQRSAVTAWMESHPP
jgi:glycerol-3-phosphate dehydrogenase